MTEETQPVKGTPHPLPPPVPADGADVPPPVSDDRPARASRLARLRSRAGTVVRGVGRGTVVALVAGLLLGSAGGFAVGAVAGGDDHGERGGVPGRPFHDEDADRPPGPPRGPGPLPPSTAPDDDSGFELDG